MSEINVRQLIDALQRCNPTAKVTIGTSDGEKEIDDILASMFGSRCVIATNEYMTKYLEVIK